jgi:uncharacterized radical SAM superfamily Fe-S cluster-containing enzyme
MLVQDFPTGSVIIAKACPIFGQAGKVYFQEFKLFKIFFHPLKKRFFIFSGIWLEIRRVLKFT